MKRRVFSLLMTLIIFGSYASSVYAEDTYPTHLMNGSFEDPVVPEISNSDGDLSSGTKGAWYLNTADGLEAMSVNGFYWKTTSSDGKIELASQKRGDVSGYNVDPYDGDQFAELVAEEQSSLYQNISTPYAGTVQNWSLSHAGRKTKDTMAVFIGPKQNDYTKLTAAGNDIFMWMAELIKSSSSIEWEKADVGCTEHTIYSQPDIDLSKVNKDNYTEYFSLTQSTLINQEWKCWLITDDPGVWNNYSGSYTVPDGQPVTTFAFTAITGYDNYSALGQYNEGNIIDGFTFATTFPLRVAVTDGGYATINTSQTQITHNNDHIASYDDGMELTVTAYPYDGYSLLGAYINGVFCTPDENGHFTETDDGGYSHPIIMDQARYVQLIFAKSGTLIYDPNGGLYKGTSNDTEITMAPSNKVTEGSYSVYEDSEIPVATQENEGKMNFIGWYVGRVTHNSTPGGALISPEYTVTYDSGQIGNTSDDTLILDYDLVVRGESGSQAFPIDQGLVFVAEWEYLQDVVLQTKTTQDAEYTDDTHGGTVTQVINDSDSSTIRQNGWGRLKDIVTLRAVANNGYRFRGWYDENGILLSEGLTYEYEVSQPTTVYAHFSEVHVPVVSFVSATGDETLNGMGTHVLSKRTNTIYENSTTGIGGTNVYGNTIATSFFTRQILDGEHPYKYTQWVITIPAPTAENPMYIKNSATPLSNDFIFESAPAIEDADEVQANKGNIYTVSGLYNNADYVTLKVYNTLPTILTGGTAEVSYALTFDNVYMPGATATLDLRSNYADMFFGSVDISEDNDKFIHSGDYDSYLTDEDNVYSSVEKEAGQK